MIDCCKLFRARSQISAIFQIFLFEMRRFQVTGKVLLRNLSGVTGVTVQALDGGGRPLSPRLIAEKSGETWRAPLGEPATTWYLVTAER
jgi:hypothetical protein